ncbi:hypothetical protein V7124_19865 [Neobacillus niacini]|uniref:hypothetical protein n=1 Tax=Neobacillus niacini TaxID=86668 RepID=UPI002FFD7857
MLDLDFHEKEYQMERALYVVYFEWWNRMLRAVQQLDDRDIQKLSNPFVIKCLPAYRKAKRKVLFVGKETNGWGLFHETLQYYKDMDEQYQRERIIRYLQWMYEDFRLRRKWDHTLFWRGCRELFQAIAPGEGDDAFLHTELIPFDYDNNRPPAHLEEKLQSEFNVLPMTIEVIKPDVVIFLTGYSYDDRLIKTFRDQRVAGDTIEFYPIDGFEERQFARISHVMLPFHTYRTYHPGYSLLNRDIVFDPIKEKITGLLNI